MNKERTKFLLPALFLLAAILTMMSGRSLSLAATDPPASQTPVPAATQTGTPQTPTPSATQTGAPQTPTPSAAQTGAPPTADASQAPSTTSAPSAMPASAKDPFTSTVYTHNEKQNGKNIFVGIDVSYHNKTIDWNKVKASGVQFVILRLGYRGYGTAGTLNLDKMFRTYAQGAADVGLPIGIYFYTEAISEAEAIEEANFCIENMKDIKISLPVAYDFEPATNKTGRLMKANLSKSQATAMCRAFCGTIKDAGYTPMIYANKSDLTNRIDGVSLGKEYKIWLAQYAKKTTFSGDYEFWQYSSSGKVNGISGSVDCNFWYTENSKPELKTTTDISELEIPTITKKIYTGKEKKPAITITYQNHTLQEGTDYLLTYENNINIGTASVTVTGMNDFTGTKTVTFKIVPKYVMKLAQKETSQSKTIVLKWSKRNTATGYLIYRKSTFNASKYKKVATIETNATNTFTDTGRSANRTFYYAVRAYTDVNGTRYYSSYSYLEAATNPTVQSQQLKKATKLYESEDSQSTDNKVLITIPKKATVLHLGKVYLDSTNFVYHVAYCVDKTTHDGYIPGDTEFIQ